MSCAIEVHMDRCYLSNCPDGDTSTRHCANVLDDALDISYGEKVGSQRCCEEVGSEARRKSRELVGRNGEHDYARIPASVEWVQQIWDVRVESARNLGGCRERGNTEAAFNKADVGLTEAGPRRKITLGEAQCLAADGDLISKQPRKASHDAP